MTAHIKKTRILPRKLLGQESNADPGGGSSWFYQDINKANKAGAVFLQCNHLSLKSQATKVVSKGDKMENYKARQKK